MKEINILWFKKDLRIFDNEALFEAIKDNDIYLFILLSQIFGAKILIQIDNGNFAKKV